MACTAAEHNGRVRGGCARERHGRSFTRKASVQTTRFGRCLHMAMPTARFDVHCRNLQVPLVDLHEQPRSCVGPCAGEGGRDSTAVRSHVDVAGVKFNATPFMQYRFPVGFGPSVKTCPKCEPQRWHLTSLAPKSPMRYSGCTVRSTAPGSVS